MTNCLTCNKKLKKYAKKYCSNECQSKHKYFEYINKWKSGLVNGSRGIVTKNISGHIKRFLIERFGEQCTICSWSKKNKITKTVPLEIDHIDGNSENNNEKNLRLICPNCHSLSPNFRNLNKGKGRTWRNIKYLKNYSPKS
ncbi:HNH endonuclease [Microgenomates group bacterium]|nr:HNH endonuclease [Microgenomates group bacterium]